MAQWLVQRAGGIRVLHDWALIGLGRMPHASEAGPAERWSCCAMQCCYVLLHGSGPGWTPRRETKRLMGRCHQVPPTLYCTMSSVHRATPGLGWHRVHHTVSRCVREPGRAYFGCRSCHMQESSRHGDGCSSWSACCGVLRKSV